MPVTLVLGSQWGDEGKGKLVDILASSADLVCRAAGGNNAGHTIVVNDVTYDFHILPSGLINPSCKINLIGTGCVVHIPSFFKELKALEEKGLQGVRERILISDRAHVCFDLHGVVDGISEDKFKNLDGGKNMIGTTRKGIGPCYSDKVARRGVTFWMLVNEQQRWERRLRDLEANYRKLYGDAALQGYNLEEEIEKLRGYREELQQYVVDQTPLLARAVGTKGMATANANGASARQPNILIEGANALLLDIDHGTYPYVTSSNTGLGGVFTGLAGLSPQSLSAPGSNIVGVVKAYTSRVGSGPFPTELNAAISPKDAEYGERLQQVGREWGVTTGRKRRCGWFDLVLVKYSAAVNCYTQLNLTKLDVLDGFEEIRVATGYKVNGQTLPGFPADLDVMEEMEVEYKTFKGWMTQTTGCKQFEDLPEQAREYIEFIEREVGVPIKWIGTGPRREDMCFR
ncbi:adenylosuccinate synthase [Cladophialophora bantiana CBS 173.52]|uniref:Adenylosuccinate synthetase n=1 Tax=Cladophialophora bantiana (strain ATCC 10958 / CBS 173.52 / CDC B-1940 / NIH 8579) TaxID=1442370 RepID=A0A0D2HW66_CLAB1|nr:adenylosuccinate synthase [Cladophialophora bantiana CBS 173.52]KIW95190.1 adenylosuccinate synthase [Cladophialophora bantiana CBS 173.52]